MESAPNHQIEILVLDDEPIVGKTVRLALERLGHHVETFESPESAMKRIDEKRFDVVVTDVVMGDVDGIQILEHTLQRWPDTKVVIITAFAYMNLARKAMDKGAFDFVAKPFDTEEIRSVVGKAVAAITG
jgi:DNA-binding NtrC family response regulator